MHYVYLSSLDFGYTSINKKDLFNGEYSYKNDKLTIQIKDTKFLVEFFTCENDNLQELVGSDQGVQFFKLSEEEYNYLKLNLL